MKIVSMSKRQKRVLIARTIKMAVNSPLVIGAFVLYGSLGAVEVGRIEFHQFIVQCLIGLGLIIFSRYAHSRIYEEDYL